MFYESNLLKLVREATPDEYQDGLTWYSRAATIADDIFGNRAVGAGVLAALSPQKSWPENQRLALNAVSGQHIGHFKGQVEKARRILEGESFLEVLAGQKERAFALCIALPTLSKAVVIDRHAFDAATGRINTDKERKVLDRVGYYESCAEVYRNVADALGLMPSQVQAICWVVWRRKKGLVP